MTQQNFVVDGPNSLVAVYSGPQSDAIEADPFTDLSKVTFHSDLDYVGFTKITKTLTVPAAASNRDIYNRVDLGPHGRGFAPVVFAILKGWINGSGTAVDIPIHGSLLLDFFGQRPADNGVASYIAPANTWDRWTNAQPSWVSGIKSGLNNAWVSKAWILGAGADETNLFAWYEQWMYNEGGATYPSTTLTIDFYVGNRSIDGQGEDTSPDVFNNSLDSTVITSNGLNVGGDGGGVFSSDLRYLHKDDLAPLLSLNSEASYSVGRVGSGYAYSDYWTFRQAPNWAYNFLYLKGSTVSPAGPATPPGSFIGMSF